MNAQQITHHFNLFLDALAARIAHGYNNTRIKGMLNENHPSGFTPAIARTLAGVPGFNPESLFPRNGNVNPTKPYRALQFMGALVHDDALRVDPVALRCFVGLREVGGTLNYDALHAIGTGGKLPVSRHGVNAPNMRGLTLARVDAAAGTRSTFNQKTVESQVSRTFGVPARGFDGEGFALALGMVRAEPGRNREVTLCPDNVFSRLFFPLVDKMTDAQLAKVMGAKGEE